MTTKIVRYKNDMLKLDLSPLNSSELKTFMAICTDLRDNGTNEVEFTFQELKSITGIKDKQGKDFCDLLDDISSTLMEVIYCEYKPVGKKGMFSFSKKCFFGTFHVDSELEIVNISVHPDMVYMLNGWSDGKWSQFAMDVFNSIRGFAAKQLFRILVQFSNYPTAYMSMEEAKLLMGCTNQRNNTFCDQTIQRAMEQFERLGIILPGWSVEKEKRKNCPDTLRFTYLMNSEIKMLNTTESKSVPKGDYFEGQLALLRQLGKPDAYIRCFEETGDLNRADMLYKFRQEHGDDVSLDDIEIAENRNKIAYLDENGVAIIDKRDIGAYGDEFPFF